jgi:hypothetical protein
MRVSIDERPRFTEPARFAIGAPRGGRRHPACRRPGDLRRDRHRPRPRGASTRPVDPPSRHPGTAHARIGFAFEPVGGWDGEPVNAEPHKHSELVWADPAALPPDTVDYTAAVIAAVERGDTFALNGW